MTKAANAARYYPFASLDSIHPLVARRREAKLRGKTVERNQFRFFRNAHSALALNIRMAPHRTNAGAGLADVPA